jgi:hypothetical protein
VIRDSVSTSLICAQLRQDGENVQELILRRKSLDAVLAGTLQDVLASREVWKLVELNGSSSRLAVRLLQSLSTVKQVQRLVFIRPTDAMISFLGDTWLAGTPHEQHARIDSLSLKSATFSVRSATALKEGLFRSSHSAGTSSPIQRLELSHSSFPSLKAIEELGIGLKEHGPLQELSLSHCHLEDEEIATLMEHLNNHPSLYELDLGVNFCQEQGTKGLAQLLVSSCPLISLNLSCQDVWDDRSYFSYLTAALSNPNCCLESLDLASNFLTDEHFEELLQALLPDNINIISTLRRLVWRDNTVTDEGMSALAKAMPRLSLRSLDITNNQYTTEGVQALERGLRSNVSLRHLSVDQPTTQLLYHLALNQGGRGCKILPNQLSLSLALWPLVLERCHTCLNAEQEAAGIAPVDLMFDLLHGPVLLEG